MIETISGKTFFDEAGEPVRDLVHVGWVETVSREDTGGSIDVRGDWTVSFDRQLPSRTGAAPRTTTPRSAGPWTH